MPNLSPVLNALIWLAALIIGGFILLEIVKVVFS